MAEMGQLHEEDRYFEANGIRLHARVWNAEAAMTPPLVIVHGIDESWRTFQALAPRFAQHRAVYAVDLRGHGESDKPETGYRLQDYAEDVLGLLPQIGSSVDLLGHSLGSIVALLVTHAHPEAVRHLVLEDPPIIQPSDVQILHEIASVSTSFKQRGSVPEAVEALTPYFAAYPREWVEMNAADIINTAPGSWDGLLTWEQDPVDWEALLPAISVPTLVLAPEPTSNQGWFAGERRVLLERLLPSGRVVTFPINAHHVSVLAPDGYVEAVQAFLREG